MLLPLLAEDPSPIRWQRRCLVVLNDGLRTTQEGLKNRRACDLIPRMATSAQGPGGGVPDSGPLEALNDQGQRLALGGPNSEPCWPTIAAHRPSGRGERLIHDLWGEDPSDTAAHSLQVYVAKPP